MADDISEIMFRADSNNSYARPTKRVFNFRIEFKNLLDLSIFYKLVFRLGLSHQLTLPPNFNREGSYDFSINNQDNAFVTPVKKLVKALLKHNIKIR